MTRGRLEGVYGPAYKQARVASNQHEIITPQTHRYLLLARLPVTPMSEDYPVEFSDDSPGTSQRAPSGRQKVEFVM